MKKRYKTFTKLLLISFFIFVIVSFIPFVSSEYIVKNSTGGSSYNYSLGSVELYNFSVNNTFSDANSNVTKVSLVLPLNLYFVSGEGSSTQFDFSNSSNSDGRDVLNWTAPTGGVLIMNNSKEYFWFEANSTSSGSGLIDISIKNSTGVFRVGGLNTNIYSPSSGGTSINLTILSPKDQEYFNTNTVWINATANDTVDTWKVNFNGTNYTGINQSFEIEDGDYDLSVYAITPSGETFEDNPVSFSVDTTTPNVNISSPRNILYNKNEIWFNFSASEDIDKWILNYNATSGENRSYEGEGKNFSEKLNISRGAWELYVYAKDFAGKTDFNSLLFSVNSNLAEDTDTPSGISETGNKTYDESGEDLTKKEDGIVNDYLQGERLKFSVKEEIYYMTVTNLTASEASLNISDNDSLVLFQNTQRIADRVEYDLDDDTKKDIMIIVNGISGGNATITLKPSYSFEPLPSENHTSQENQTSKDDGKEGAGTAFVIIVGGVFLIALIGIIYYVQKHQKEQAEKRKKSKSIYEDPNK